VDWQILQFVQKEALAPVPLAGTEVHRKLQDEFPDSAVSLRTVQMLLSEWRPPEGEEKAWTLADADPEDAALILPVLGELTRRDKGARGVSQQIAQWLVRVRTIAPDMPLLSAFDVSAFYAHAERTGGETAYLDTFLALEAWRSREAEEQAIIRRWLPVNWGWVGPGSAAIWGRAKP
jgi:hypothetical protein